MKKSRIAFLGTGALATVMLVAALTMAGGKANATDPSGGRYTFIDNARQTEFLIYLDPSATNFGRFSFGVQGLGLFFSTAAATVNFNSDHSVVVQYSGSGLLDPNASLDFVFGMSQSSGTTDPVSIQLQAQINPDRVTSSAELWYGGAQYKLVDTRPPADPTDALNAALAALQQKDWAGLYGMSFSLLQNSMSQADYVAQISAGWAGSGTITAITVTSPPQLNDGRAGFDMARASASVTMTSGTTTTTYPIYVTLLEEPSGWKLFSIDPQS